MRFRIQRVELTVACNRDSDPVGSKFKALFRLSTRRRRDGEAEAGWQGGGGMARRRWGLGFVERTLPSSDSEAFSLFWGGFRNVDIRRTCSARAPCSFLEKSKPYTEAGRNNRSALANKTLNDVPIQETCKQRTSQDYFCS